MMQEKQANKDKALTKDELLQYMSDVSAEESDLEFGKRHEVKLRRPPVTSSEALKTLQEADARFELGKDYLAGGSHLLYK